MNRIARHVLVAALAMSFPLQAFGWGTVTGPRGGSAYRGPMGGGYAHGPNGGTAARGPYGAGAAVGPHGGAAVRGPYGGAAAVGPNGGAAVRAPYPGGAVRPPYYGGAVAVRPWTPYPYYGAVVAGVTLGTVIAATAPPRPPSPSLCWFWTSPAQNQGYWDYCAG
jgi:hypothetical protein